MGSIGQNSTFSQHGHVAYEIKENHKCSDMVANIVKTHVHKQPIIALYFESENELKFYNLQA